MPCGRKRAATATRDYGGKLVASRVTNVMGLGLIPLFPLSLAAWYRERHDAQVVAGKPSGLGQRFAA